MTPFRLLCLLALCFCAQGALGAPSLEAYGKLPKVSRMVISPNGEREDHYLQEGSTRLQALQAMIAFVDQHIGSDGAAR